MIYSLTRALCIIGFVACCICRPALAGGVHDDDTTCTDDAMIVFDASGSMGSVGYNELEIPRIHEALDAMRDVLPQVTPYRRLGLVVYGPGPKDACSNIDMRLPPSSNAARQIIRELEKLEPNGNTPLTQSVQIAAEVLDYRKRPSVIVLVTDGDETCGGTPCRLAAKLRVEAAAISIHVIGFKVRDKFFQWRSQTPGEDKGDAASRCLADATGGTYVSTETTEELTRALQVTLGCPVLSRPSSHSRERRPALQSKQKIILQADKSAQPHNFSMSMARFEFSKKGLDKATMTERAEALEWLKKSKANGN